MNFSGINTSPFEYDDGSEEMAALNQIAQKIIKERCPEMENWKIGKIDKVYHEDRQSIAYNDKIGLFEGKFPTMEEFYMIWKLKFSTSQEAAKLNAKD